MSRMVEMVIDSVRVSLTNQQRIVVLREVNAERYLTIWIGQYEAESITIALQDIEVSRPQTHDLLKNVLSSLNARLLRIEVVALREEVYYGHLVVEVNGQIMQIDSRPSDALALAVRVHVPVFVAESVMLEAGTEPEQELAAETAEDGPGDGNDRLEVFKDFVEKLDLDDIGPEDEPES